MMWDPWSRSPECTARIDALKSILAEQQSSQPNNSSKIRKPSLLKAITTAWGLTALLLFVFNPFSFANFLVQQVAGRIAVTRIQVYHQNLDPSYRYYSYTDALGHYHGSPYQPYVVPLTGFEDLYPQVVRIADIKAIHHVAVPPMSVSPQSLVKHKHGKISSDDWHKFAQALEPFLKIAGFLAFICLFASAVMTRRYIRKSELGLLVSDSPDFRPLGTTAIPWDCLKRVTVTSDWLGRVRFDTDHSPGVAHISWHDITRSIEPGEFIAALRTFAPNAVQNCKFPTENRSLKSVDEHTYTKLWFKYYSTGTERQRGGQLAGRDELQDGRFKIVERLGSGGQGTAYLALDQSGLPPAATGAIAEVVLKEYILPVHRGEQVMEQSAKRLRLEADLLQKIDHPNIVKLLDEFIEDHRGYLVMEYVRGTQLKTLVTQEGPQPEATVRELALQICDILEYLHEMDPPIIHRDLTPDNLILQSDGIIKLVDFNVAHQLESVATATVVGKHAYIPPEQFRGKPTRQSDIYALGCTLHFLLTGQEPEPLTVSSPRLLNEAVSEQLNEIIATCTSLDATKRFESVQKMKDALLSKVTPRAVIKLNHKIEV
ncbi:MAG TPA: serine/threonine-protein kinase [Candidatus Obscuribacterales bacterium]